MNIQFFEKIRKKSKNFQIFFGFYRNFLYSFSMKIFEIFDFRKISSNFFFSIPKYLKSIFAKKKYFFSSNFFQHLPRCKLYKILYYQGKPIREGKSKIIKRTPQFQYQNEAKSMVSVRATLSSITSVLECDYSIFLKI